MLPYLIITILALVLGLSVTVFVWSGLRDSLWEPWRDAVNNWQVSQGQRLKALGANAQSVKMGWAPSALGMGLGLLLGIFLGSWIFIFLGLGLGMAWPSILESHLKSKRLQQLGEQLPSLFEALASALRSGQSLTQALSSCVEDLPAPSNQLMGEVLRRVRLGDEVEVALLAAGAVLDPSPLRADWRMLVTAVAVVRSSGGKLPEILDQLAVTVRERQRLQAQVKAQTAQAKLSGWVIGCMPPLLLLAMQILDPELTAPLFNTGIGWGILATAVSLETVGLFLLKRMAEVTV